MPQALKLFGYGLLDVLGTGGPDSYGVSASALVGLQVVHAELQRTSWGKGEGAATSIAISWMMGSIHRSAGGVQGLDRASRHERLHGGAGRGRGWCAAQQRQLWWPKYRVI